MAKLVIEKRDSGVFRITDGSGAVDIMQHDLGAALDQLLEQTLGVLGDFGVYETADLLEQVMDREHS